MRFAQISGNGNHFLRKLGVRFARFAEELHSMSARSNMQAQSDVVTDREDSIRVNVEMHAPLISACR